MSHRGLLFNWFCSGGEEHFGQEPTAQNHGEIIAWPAGSSEGLQPGSPALCSTGTGHCTSRPRGWGSEQGGSELRPQSLGLATPSTSKKKLLKELQISDKAWSCPAPGTGWQHPGVTQRHGAAGAATTDDLQPKGFVMGSGAGQGAAGAGREAGGPAEAA